MHGDIALITLANGLRNASQMTSFELYAGETKVADASIKAITECFLGCDKLEQLTLNFGQTLVKTNDGLLALAKTLTTLKKLTKFSLEVYCTEIGDEGITAVAKSLKQTKRLKYLAFGLGETKIVKDSTLIEMGKAV